MPRSRFLEPTTVEIRHPFGGLVSSGIADLLRDNDLSRCLNFHQDRGGLSKRRGRHLVGTLPSATPSWCLFHMRTDAEAELLLVAGEHLVLIPEGGGVPMGAVSGAWPPIASDLIGNGTKRGKAVQFNDYLFYADGGSVRRAYKQGTPGVTMPWGYQGGDTPAPTDGGAAAGGALTDLAYYGTAYAYRDPVRNITIKPSARMVFGPVATPNLTRNVTIPAFAGWTPDFSEILVYRTLATQDATQAANETLHLERILTGVAALPQSTTLSLADGDLPGDVPYDEAAPPPEMDFLCLFAERIFGFKGSKVYFSENGLEEGGVWSFNPLSEVPVEYKAGNPINALFVLQGQIYVVLRSAGVFLLSPTTDAEGNLAFQVQKQAGAMAGSCSPFAVAVADNYAYWLDDRGVVEFDGTNVRFISDSPDGQRAGIRDLFLEYRATQRLVNAYAEMDRQPDRRYIRWIVPRDATGSNGLPYSVADHLVFDLENRTFHVERPGGDPAADRMTGLFERMACQYRDTDGATWVYTADEDGNVYRLRTDEAGAEVWTDNGTDYEAEVWTKLFGDGISRVMPLTFDAEILRSLMDQTDGVLTFTIYRDGFEDATPKTQEFSLFDEFDTLDASRTYTLNANRKLCKRVALGIHHDGGQADLTIARLLLRLQVEARAERGA